MHMKSVCAIHHLFMKRYKFLPGTTGEDRPTLFETICSEENLTRALYNAAHNKYRYSEVRFAIDNQDIIIPWIQDNLIYHRFKTSEYHIFKKKEGNKERIIYSLPFLPDRVVQWAIIQVIGPIMERSFIPFTYSSLKGRGPLKCMNQVYHDMHYDKENTQWCLKIDIQKFYPSIDRYILKLKYRRLFKDDELLDILDEIIDSPPGDVGIPIGNYISQFSGNLYLSNFDHYIKECSGIKHYYRYMDDMVFLADTKERLLDLLDIIKTILENDEHLKIKPNYQLFDTNKRGVDFVGYVIHHDHIRVRKSTRNNYRRSTYRILKYKSVSQHSVSQFFSYVGFLRHSNSFNLQCKYSSDVLKMWNDHKHGIHTYDRRFECRHNLLVYHGGPKAPR